MDNYLPILIVSYFMLLTVILFDRKFKVGFYKEVIVSSFLSLAQLIGIGFLILLLLKFKIKVLNLLLVLFFYINGTIIANKRFKFKGYPKSWGLVITFTSLSLISTLSLTLLYLAGILKLKANSLIPLSGIVTAAGMRSLSLSYSYLKSKLKDLEDIILGIAALGATKEQIFLFIFKDLINHITTPVRDMLRSAGIVHIPGVMVGLLLAGVIPVKAALIQFLILSVMLFQFTLVPSLALFMLIKKYGIKIETGGDS